MLEVQLSGWIWFAAGFLDSLKRLMLHQAQANSGADTITMISRLILALPQLTFFP